MPQGGDKKECGGSPSGTQGGQGYSHCLKCGETWYPTGKISPGARCTRILTYHEGSDNPLSFIKSNSTPEGDGWYFYGGSFRGYVRVK